MGSKRKAGFTRLQKMNSYDELVEQATYEEKVLTLDRIGPKLKEMEIAISDTHPFKAHPFRVVDDEAMESLAESIKNRGVLHPIVVRESSEGGFEVISGHRRRFACIKAGLKTIPAYIVDLSDDEATILMADANFYQREGLLPSEKAKAYRMKSDAIKRHQGSVGSKYTIDEIGEGTKDSSTQIKRYIRLSYLSDELLLMIDEKRVGIDQGVQFSYMDEDQQKILYEAFTDIIQGGSLKVPIQVAKDIREASKEPSFSKELLFSLLIKNEHRKRKYVIKEKILNKFFDYEVTEAEIENVVEKALAMYFEKEGGVS